MYDLAIFFSALDYSDHQIGVFMTLTLLGDAFLGTFLTLIADRVGRRNVLMGGSFLMVVSGVVFAVFENFWILLFAAILGVISVTGGDFGPFRSIEEYVLFQCRPSTLRACLPLWAAMIKITDGSISSQIRPVTIDDPVVESRRPGMVCHDLDNWVEHWQRGVWEDHPFPAKPRWVERG